MFHVLLLAGVLTFFSAPSVAGNCEAIYDCGGCNGAYGTIRCVCKDVPGRIECTQCNTNNPCAGECMACCYKNLGTGQTCCNRATCARNVWCSSGCGASEGSIASSLARQPAGTGPGHCVGLPLSGRQEILVSNGLAIESVEGTSQLQIVNPAVIFDEGKDVVGLEFAVANRGIETIVAHGFIVELYWQGVSEPVRLFHIADGWFDGGGLAPGSSARYYASAAIKPAGSGLLERVVIGADYAETKTGRSFGPDVGRFGELLRAQREVQRQVSSAVQSLVQAEREPGVLRRQIQELASRFRSTGARIAIGRYLELLDEGGPQLLLREAERRQ